MLHSLSSESVVKQPTNKYKQGAPGREIFSHVLRPMNKAGQWIINANTDSRVPALSAVTRVNPCRLWYAITLLKTCCDPHSDHSTCMQHIMHLNEWDTHSNWISLCSTHSAMWRDRVNLASGSRYKSCKVSVEKPVVNWPLERRGHGWEDNIKTDLKYIGWDSEDWINLTEGRINGRSL